MKLSKYGLNLAFFIVLIINNNFLLAQNELSQIENCWSQKQILTKKETAKIGKYRNFHIHNTACSSETETLWAVEIEYKLLISNQNRFAGDENFNQNYYETRLAYIDADELENMIFALQKLQLQLNSPKIDTTEFQYTSRAGFKIHSVFNPQWEKWLIYVEFSDKKRNKITRNTLIELTKLLQQAMQKIKS